MAETAPGAHRPPRAAHEPVAPSPGRPHRVQLPPGPGLGSGGWRHPRLRCQSQPAEPLGAGDLGRKGKPQRSVRPGKSQDLLQGRAELEESKLEEGKEDCKETERHENHWELVRRDDAGRSCAESHLKDGCRFRCWMTQSSCLFGHGKRHSSVYVQTSSPEVCTIPASGEPVCP